MNFLPREPHVVGLDVGPSFVRFASLVRTRNGWKVGQLQEFSEESHVKPLDILPKEAISVSALSSRSILVRSLNLPLKKEKDIAAALEFQAEPLLPYPVEEALIESVVIERQAQGTRMTLCAVRQDHVKQHLETLPLDPERVTCTPLALAALSTTFEQRGGVLILIHMGENEGTCVLVENGKLLMTHHLEVASAQKGILSLCMSPKGKSVETLYFIGEDEGLAKEIEEATEKRVVVPKTSLGISEKNLCTFGLAIGTALASADENRPNFRKKAFAYPHPWKRAKKPLTTFFVGVALLAVSLFGLGQLTLNKQEAAIADDYQALLLTLEKEGALPKEGSKRQAALTELEQYIADTPNTFPLLPSVPKVRDVLAWLSTHPQLVEEGGKPLIEVENFHYTFVKHPDLAHKKERYSVRVDLEFTAPHPSVARAFHDALLANNPLVDNKKEVQWHTSNGGYRTSFYLKDKTRYHS